MRGLGTVFDFLKRSRSIAVILLSVAVLFGCGSDDSQSSSSTGGGGAEEVEDGLALDIEANPIKRLVFSWSGQSGQGDLDLFEDVGGEGQFVEMFPISPNVSSVSVEVPLHLIHGARYFLRECVGQACSESGHVGVPEGLTGGIGYFKSPSIERDAEFGSSVALSSDGSVMAVGAPVHVSSFGVYDSVSVFERDPRVGSWVFKTQLFSRFSSKDQFGGALSLSADGDTLVVGAWGDDTMPGDGASGLSESSGAAYVFQRNPDGVWVERAYLKAAAEDGKDHPQDFEKNYFGDAVEVSGDGNTIAVGAPGADFAKGAVYLYTKKTADSWGEGQKVVAPVGEGFGDEFGSSIALSADGSKLVAGAPFEGGTDSDIATDAHELVNAGAVYVFERGAANSWQFVDYIKSRHPGDHDWFGSAVALSDDGSVVAVGAPGEEGSGYGVGADEADDSSYRNGAVFVFRAASGGWVQDAYIKASNSRYYMLFGGALAMSADGNILIVGADNEGGGGSGVNPATVVGGASSSGAAYAFRYGKDGWRETAYLKAPNPGLLDQFGRSVSATGDGLTVAVGAPYEDGGLGSAGEGQFDDSVYNAGAVYLY